MSEIVKTLIEMGFDETRAEIAVSRTNGRDVQEAMEWILAHEDEIVEIDKPVSSKQETGASQQASSSTSRETSSEIVCSPHADASTSAHTTTEEARSLKCDECGRLFKTQLEVEFHAAKSGHSSFSESTEEKKPLTDEEKKAQLARLDDIMRQKRKEREEREKQDALEREKVRIKSGKEITEARRKHEDIEMKKILELRKREKQEEKQARERIKEQIEQDKIARKTKFGQPGTTATLHAVAATPTSSTSLGKNYSEAKLQIRLTNGTALTQTFGAKEPLSAVRLYVEINRTDEPGPFSLMTSFPRKTFGPEDYDKPLDLLGLAPSAVIIVTKG